MKKLFLALCLILAVGITPCYSANEWRNVDTDFQDGDVTYFNDIDTDLSDHVIEPLSRLLAGYRKEAKITYNSAAAFYVEAGEVACSNSGGTLIKMRRTTSTTTVTWADIDTGSEAASTTYYVYAVADADATTFTVKISLSATAPDSVTYYAKLGSFYNNSSSNIEQFANDDTEIAISTGTVANGGTITLPSGYAESQCDWVVTNGTPTGSAGTSDGVRDMKQTASVTSSRVATCKRTRVYASTTEDIANTCGYIIICYK